MRGPNSVSIRGPASIVALRRSRRFIQPKSVDPEAPDPESSLVLVCTTSPKSYINNSRKLRKSEVSEVKERSRSLNELDTGKRRSPRLKAAGEEGRCIRRSPRFSIVEALNWDKFKERDCERGRRQNSVCELDSQGSRSWNRSNAGSRNRSRKCHKKTVSEHSSTDGLVAKNVSMVEELNKAVSSSKIFSSDNGKRVTRSTRPAIVHKGIEVLTPVGKVYQDIVRCIMADPIRCVDKKGVCNQADKEQLGGKRMNTSTGDGHPALQGRMSGPEMKNIHAAEQPPKVQGWTREQELVLQRAYFSAKPTPRFWKKVAKMVPGKSAQECFEKIHSDNLTPPQPQRRHSKAKRASLLSVPLSASQLLSPLGSKGKKSRHVKRKHYCCYKNVRQLLHKQTNTDQKSGADLFSVLEPSFCLSSQSVQDAAVVSHSNKEQSSSALRNNTSGLGDLDRASFSSPPVLKKIKNKALHEKYIDQLHNRETKRNVASLRATRCLKGKNDAKENQVLKEEAIKRAKSSLIVNARSAINQFLQQQSTMTGDSDDANDDVDDSTEDEIED